MKTLRSRCPPSHLPGGFVLIMPRLYVMSRCNPRNLYYNTSKAQSFLNFIDFDETKIRKPINFKPVHMVPRACSLCRPLLEVLHLDPTSLLDGTDNDGTGLTRASNALKSSLGLVTVDKEAGRRVNFVQCKGMRSIRLTQRQ